MSETPAPGIYTGVPFEEYESWDAINQSALKDFKRSAAHFRWNRDNPQRGESLDFGRAVHHFTLESDTFNDHYLIGIDGDGRTKEVKEARARLAETANGRTILKPAEMEKIHAIGVSVVEHPKAREYITTSKREVSLLWHDRETGLPCKARLDLLREHDGLVGDLKTTGDASPSAFARTILQFGYHNQAAFYRSGCVALGVVHQHHVLIAAETEPPHCVAVYRLADEVIDLAGKENAELLRKYATCRKENRWPGFPETVQDIGIPAWGVIQLEERYGQVY